jgi:hypothetical protein
MKALWAKFVWMCAVYKLMLLLSLLSVVAVLQWNNHGYDVAKWFGAKFTHISPVWLQIKKKPGGAFVITGGHDIDKGRAVCLRHFDCFFLHLYSAHISILLNVHGTWSMLWAEGVTS